jgi:hypothetical protein
MITISALGISESFDCFMNSKAKSMWLHSPDNTLEVYVRKAKRMLAIATGGCQVFADVLDIANVTSSRKGEFREFMLHVERSTQLPIYMENILTARMLEIVLKNGYTLLPSKSCQSLSAIKYNRLVPTIEVPMPKHRSFVEAMTKLQEGKTANPLGGSPTIKLIGLNQITPSLLTAIECWFTLDANIAIYGVKAEYVPLLSHFGYVFDEWGEHMCKTATIVSTLESSINLIEELQVENPNLAEGQTIRLGNSIFQYWRNKLRYITRYVPVPALI